MKKLAPVPEDSEQPPQADLPRTEEQTVTLVWGGDVNLGRRQHYRNRESLQPRILDIPELHAADLAIVNLECVLATCGDQGVAKGEGGPYYYRAKPEMLSILLDAGVNMVTTANNHSGDYGPEAQLQQQMILNAVGLPCAGSGRNAESAFRPTYYRAGHLNVAVFAIDSTQHRFAATATTPGNAWIDLKHPEQWHQILKPRIQQARTVADIVLVAVHWGDNNRPEPCQNEIAVGHAIIDAGADAVLGASAHQLQGIEIYRSRPVIHDAGDLLFDAIRNTLADSGLFELTVSSRGVEKLRFIPVGAGFGFTRKLYDEDARTLSEKMLQLSQPFGCNLTIDESDGSAYVTLTPPARSVIQRSELKNPHILPQLLNRFAPVPEDYQTTSVPEHCRITPVRLGPLTLLGVHISPDNIQQRQMIYVESYWCCDEHISEDMRLDIRAVPMMQSSMPDWGNAMDHDPCDWMQPTSQWQPGVIYRDRYGLRPPPLSAIKNIALKISISLTGTPAARKAGKYIVPQIIHINIPGCSAYENTDYRQIFSDKILKTSSQGGWDARQLAEITGGHWINPPADDWLVQSVVRASNHINCVTAPCLYVASDYVTLARHEQYGNMQKVYDNNWNSHRKIKQVHHRIAGAMVSETTGLSALNLPLLKVQDPIKAMIEIGIASRKRLKGKVICITGSAGKSSTLHAMKVILSQHQKVWTTYNNYNSRVGLFVVLASTPFDADFVVLETAISAINTSRYKHIGYVAPDITVITNISAAHLKPGETTLDIARKKTNIFNGMQPGTTAVICSETEHFDYMIDRAAEFKLKTIRYGLSDNDHIQLKNLDDQGIAHIRLFDQYIELPCGHQPEHIVLNLLSCLAVLVLSEENYTEYLEAFSRVGAIEGRGIRSDIATSFGRIQIIDDAYNANPISMKAAFRAFKACTTTGRKIMVLGDMLELSDQSEHYHQALTPLITDVAADQVLLIGEQMSKILPGLESNKVPCRFFESTETLTQHLAHNSQDQDLILFKASNGTGLQRVIQQLQQQVRASDHT